MGTSVDIGIIIVKTLILISGGVVTYFAYKAYRRTGQRSIGLLSLGFAFITVGLLLAGLFTQVLAFPLRVSILIESSLVLIGMLIIAYSLYDK